MTQLSPELAHKRDQLLVRMKKFERVAVAFSGGVDSSVVAKAAQIACDQWAIALTAVSPSRASGELKIPAEVASAIGIRHELSKMNSIRNSNACNVNMASPPFSTVPISMIGAIIDQECKLLKTIR